LIPFVMKQSVAQRTPDAFIKFKSAVQPPLTLGKGASLENVRTAGLLAALFAQAEDIRVDPGRHWAVVVDECSHLLLLHSIIQRTAHMSCTALSQNKPIILFLIMSGMITARYD
jgi:hypothetical protein